MLCEKCKKETATVFYKENVNGKIKKYSLCENCAKELEEKGEMQNPDFMFSGFYDPFSEFTNSLFSGFFGFPSIGSSKNQKKCPTCGSTYAEISNSGKVGCADCYQTFSDELSHLIQSVHGTTHHNGSIPSKQREKNHRNEQLKSLKKELSQAVELEEYERAAQLRDEIRKIEQENKGLED